MNNPIGEGAREIAGDWIEWGGGECPVAPDVEVEILHRCEQDGSELYVDAHLPAADVDWKHGKRRNRLDVVAYRLLASTQVTK